MTIPTHGQMLRVFVGESDHIEGRPLYEAIVRRARADGLAGATVSRGFMGFGAHSHMLAGKMLGLSGDTPVVIEIVDAPEKIKTFVEHIDPMIGDGLMTIESLDVLVYRANRER